ncbi:hypothetical protein B0H16DRAFT_1540428 [Mycena metata]|uniref:Uncharacterized protein n=1 Tax=Mycena metata TaxID=1033252 RepID=A0AAD7NCV9_9AGAR|nr:hypothetical protein B0H16DRAFT_1540428 [Mycena metata]
MHTRALEKRKWSKGVAFERLPRIPRISLDAASASPSPPKEKEHKVNRPNKSRHPTIKPRNVLILSAQTSSSLSSERCEHALQVRQTQTDPLETGKSSWRTPDTRALVLCFPTTLPPVARRADTTSGAIKMSSVRRGLGSVPAVFVREWVGMEGAVVERRGWRSPINLLERLRASSAGILRRL